MLVAVMMAFVIFSFTGIAVMNVSYLSQSTSQATVNNIKLQYEVESSINTALWRINAGSDSLANISIDGVTTVWDSTAMTLTVNVDKYQIESEILLDLSEDTHFDRGIAAEEEIILNGYDPGLGSDQQIRDNFQFLPETDLAYFTDNPEYIHTQSFHDWDGDVLDDGRHLFTGNNIHLDDVVLDSGVVVFTGNYVTIENITVNSGTLVFTGYGVQFLYNNRITAPPADTTGANPAVIFTHPNQNFDMYSMYRGETIIGALYCKGNVYLRNGFLSGPVIGKKVIMYGNFNFLDAENTQNYQWTHGFGQRNGYDWPKQIGRWRIHKWIQKHFQVDA
jgi:hypothetical protein